MELPAQEPLPVLASLASLALRLVLSVSLAPQVLSLGQLGVPPTCALLWKLLLLVAREALATLVARPVAALAVQALGVAQILHSFSSFENVLAIF